jgi:hypothetical protein
MSNNCQAGAGQQQEYQVELQQQLQGTTSPQSRIRPETNFGSLLQREEQCKWKRKKAASVDARGP